MEIRTAVENTIYKKAKIYEMVSITLNIFDRFWCTTIKLPVPYSKLEYSPIFIQSTSTEKANIVPTIRERISKTERLQKKKKKETE